MFPIHEFISLFVTSDNDVDSNLNGVDEDKINTRERLRYFQRTETDIRF